MADVREAAFAVEIVPLYKWRIEGAGAENQQLRTNAEVRQGDFVSFDGLTFLVVRRMFSAQVATLFVVPSVPKWPEESEACEKRF